MKRRFRIFPRKEQETRRNVSFLAKVEESDVFCASSLRVSSPAWIFNVTINCIGVRDRVELYSNESMEFDPKTLARANS